MHGVPKQQWAADYVQFPGLYWVLEQADNMLCLIFCGYLSLTS